jgi:hypothetical protein
MADVSVLDPPRPGERQMPATPPPDEGGWWGDRWLAWARRPESVITLFVVAAASIFVFFQLQPSKLFLNTTPSGGDMGAHVWLPAYLRDHLLHHFRITGWTPDWYAGFPALLYYFPLPSLLIVVLNVVIPYNVAFKLVTVMGLVLLPVAAWAFGRLARMRFPGPACLAAATLPFLFSKNFTIYGGNIASTLAGEFSFSISLAAALIFLGLVARGLETGKYRAWAAVALFVTGTCHLLPTVFAVVGAIVLTLLHEDRASWFGWPTRIFAGLTVVTLGGHLIGLIAWDVPLAFAVLTLMAPVFRFQGKRWKWTAPVLAVSAFLAALWTLPFLFRLPYATDMGYEKLTAYAKNLFPADLVWLFILAGLGVFVSVVRRHRIGLFLTIMAVLSLLIFRFAPQARLWNARVLPFWFLCLYLLAGVAFAEGGRILVELVTAEDPDGIGRWGLLPVPVVAAIAALVWVSFPLRILPFGHTDARTSRYSWLGIKTADHSFIPDWVRWNYSGYESTTKARQAEYFGLVKTMANLGKSNGCGRAMWEYEPEEDQMGTPMALMLLPYWTHSCIGSMEGLYFESSGTTPYHFLNAAELSLKPSNPVRGLNYPSAPDVTMGIEHLQMLGVRYYMALTPETQAQADTNPNLRLVASSGPWSVTYYSGNNGTPKQRTWKIYEVSQSELVAPLVNQPVVMTGVSGGKNWLKPSQAWYLDPSRWDVVQAASGPGNWTRVLPSDTSPPRTPLPPVQVSNIKSGDDNVSFNVDTVGVPVVVKASYFPNWHTSGARGPYRVTPNLMVVIPTSHHVRLHYGYTPIDEVGIVFSLLGVAGLVWFVRRPLKWEPSRSDRAPTGRGAFRSRPSGPVGSSALVEPYQRLEYELAGAFPVGADGWTPHGSGDDLDAWLGFPDGLDPAGPRPLGAGQSGPGNGRGSGLYPAPRPPGPPVEPAPDPAAGD